jgi:hypothetical protein
MFMMMAIAAAAAGPVGKFEARQVVAEYDSVAKMEDVERCLVLMDAGAPPLIYKQDDRPDDVMLVWMKTGPFYGVPGARLDMHRTPSGTHIRSWMPAKQVRDCAP